MRKNTVLFATLIEAISSMDDVQMSQMLGYANQVLSNKAGKKVKEQTESKLNAKNQSVKFNVAKNVVSIDGFYPKDVFGVIKHELELAGVEYTRGVGFTFKTAKAAKEYASKRTEVTSAERNEYRKTVYGWA